MKSIHKIFTLICISAIAFSACKKPLEYPIIPAIDFKKIEGVKDLYEIRIEYESNIYRIFCCFDKGKIVVLFNCFQKKSQKTPSREIDKAIKIMNEYFNEIKK